MTHEENIVKSLAAKFDFLRDKIKIQRQRRVFADVPADRFFEVLEYCINELNFTILCTITGLDEVNNFAFIYHIASDAGIVLNLKITSSRENPVISTVTKYFTSADIYEREIADLLGVKIEGLAEGKRYPLPDDWPEGNYPLRKDWKKEDLEKE